MPGWEIALMAVAALVAVSSLARMMRERRDRLVAEVERQMAAHREAERRAGEEKKNKAKGGAA